MSKDKTKFLVWKLDELLSLSTEAELKIIDRVMERIVNKRAAEGKDLHTRYLVINTDESYADEVIKIMKEHGDWG
jgi:CBS domain-containing protein